MKWKERNNKTYRGEESEDRSSQDHHYSHEIRHVSLPCPLVRNHLLPLHHLWSYERLCSRCKYNSYRHLTLKRHERYSRQDKRRIRECKVTDYPPATRTASYHARDTRIGGTEPPHGEEAEQTRYECDDDISEHSSWTDIVLLEQFLQF